MFEEKGNPETESDPESHGDAKCGQENTDTMEDG